LDEKEYLRDALKENRPLINPKIYKSTKGKCSNFPLKTTPQSR